MLSPSPNHFLHEFALTNLGGKSGYTAVHKSLSCFGSRRVRSIFFLEKRLRISGMV